MKRFGCILLAFTLLIACLTVVLVGCSASKETPLEDKERIGIISAMDNEIDTLLSAATVERYENFGDVAGANSSNIVLKLLESL